MKIFRLPSLYSALTLLAASTLWSADEMPGAPVSEAEVRMKQLEAEGPWLTGPLLTPSATTIPVGHFNFEPYIFVTKTSHQYNKHWHSTHTPTFVSVNLQLPFWVGLGNRWDFFINPQASWNHSKGAAKTVFNDLSLGFEYQFLKPKKGRWYPQAKISVYETFPTGKYQHLDPSKHGTDAGGKGSYSTQVAMTFSKAVYFGDLHWLRTRLNFTYVYYAPVHVKGFNAYGGAADTKAKVFPGNQFVTLLGFEYTLSMNWALALDFQYQHFNKTRFSGFAGDIFPTNRIVANSGTMQPEPAVLGGPSSEQFSMAPAIEYNWNGNLGIIGGAWFSFAGRNSSDFISYSVAFNWYY